GRAVLEILGALLGGHHHLSAASGRFGGVQSGYRRHDGGGYRRAPQQYWGARDAGPSVGDGDSLQLARSAALHVISPWTTGFVVVGGRVAGQGNRAPADSARAPSRASA